MLRSNLRLAYADAKQKLLPMLRGEAFHVTCRSNLDAIETAGVIEANADRRFRGAFGDYNSCFRQKGCVSVFDYRTASDEQIQDSLDRCHPWSAGGCEHELAIFVLSANASANLIPCDDWKTCGSMVVPFVEAGYPAAIPRTAWKEIMEVFFHWEPNPFLIALERRQSG